MARVWSLRPFVLRLACLSLAIVLTACGDGDAAAPRPESAASEQSEAADPGRSKAQAPAPDEPGETDLPDASEDADGSGAWCGTGGAAGDGWMDEPGPWSEPDGEGVQTRVRMIGGGWPSVEETKRLEARKADLAKRVDAARRGGAGDSVHALLMQSELEMIGRRLRGDSATWIEHRIEVAGRTYASRPLENRSDFLARARTEVSARDAGEDRDKAIEPKTDTPEGGGR